MSEFYFQRFITRHAVVIVQFFILSGRFLLKYRNWCSNKSIALSTSSNSLIHSFRIFPYLFIYLFTYWASACM